MNTYSANSFSKSSLPADMTEESREKLFLPPSMVSGYKIISCLKYSEQSATYLMRSVQSGKTVLLKTSSDTLFTETLINEKNILDFIHQQEAPLSASFPQNLESELHQDTFYYTRTYIEGRTLEELCESNIKKPGMSSSLALNYAIQLAELLHFLHTLKPPVIHRDIKPQNVVVDNAGCCHFIDMGISRFFGKAKKNDTIIMGTRITAPPEQFGYQQTDIRSDLYSLGVLMHYCITGEYAITDKTLAELDPDIRKIVKKATMFDPDKRYQTTDEMLPELLEARYHGFLESPAFRNQKRTISWRSLALSLLLLNLGLAGILLYQNTRLPLQNTLSPSASSVETSASDYTFREALIEEAVRKILNIPEGPVTTKDLEKVTALHIMGLQIYSDDSEIWFKGDYPWFFDDETRESGLYLQQGTISSLEDLTHMPNLKTVSLYGQQISDISVLKDTTVENLGLGYNPLTDLSALERNTSLRSLNLASLELTDTGLLASLPNLEILNISGTDIDSLQGLENCVIRELNAFDVNLKNYGEIRTLPCLEKLVLGYMNPDILEKLADLSIKDLSFHYSHDVSLDSFSVLPKPETLFFTGNGEEYLKTDHPDLPSLKSLDLNSVKLMNFHCLSSLTSLTTLQIYGADCESYEGLTEIPNLRFINATDQQEKEILIQFPENKFSFKLL